MTKAEWIRGMCDREMADFLASLALYFIRHYGNVELGPKKIRELQAMYLAFVQSEKEDAESEKH